MILVVLALRIYALTLWRRIDEDPARQMIVAGLAAAVLGYLAASLFQNVLWDRNVWIAIALMTWAAQTETAFGFHRRRPNRGCTGSPLSHR